MRSMKGSIFQFISSLSIIGKVILSMEPVIIFSQKTIQNLVFLRVVLSFMLHYYLQIKVNTPKKLLGHSAPT